MDLYKCLSTIHHHMIGELYSLMDDQTPEEGYQEKYELGEFIDMCKIGVLIDDDGVGVFWGESENSPQKVSPSDLFKIGFEPPNWATHVIWYNK